jgi:hypothetical protein
MALVGRYHVETTDAGDDDATRVYQVTSTHDSFDEANEAASKTVADGHHKAGVRVIPVWEFDDSHDIALTPPAEHA